MKNDHMLISILFIALFFYFFPNVYHGFAPLMSGHKEVAHDYTQKLDDKVHLTICLYLPPSLILCMVFSRDPG